MFHTWAITTGQKTSKVIAVGMACCPKIPTPASTLVPFVCGSIFVFRAIFRPMMALKVPPLRMLTCRYHNRYEKGFALSKGETRGSHRARASLNNDSARKKLKNFHKQLLVTLLVTNS
jgi:hypothetical protein